MFRRQRDLPRSGLSLAAQPIGNAAMGNRHRPWPKRAVRIVGGAYGVTSLGSRWYFTTSERIQTMHGHVRRVASWPRHPRPQVTVRHRRPRQGVGCDGCPERSWRSRSIPGSGCLPRRLTTPILMADNQGTRTRAPRANYFARRVTFGHAAANHHLSVSPRDRYPERTRHESPCSDFFSRTDSRRGMQQEERTC